MIKDIIASTLLRNHLTVAMKTRQIYHLIAGKFPLKIFRITLRDSNNTVGMADLLLIQPEFQTFKKIKCLLSDVICRFEKMVIIFVFYITFTIYFKPVSKSLIIKVITTMKTLKYNRIVIFQEIINEFRGNSALYNIRPQSQSAGETGIAPVILH